MALYNDYRPSELSEIFGNESVVDTLATAIEEDQIPHTILLSGPSGCGKTTIARILAEHLSSGSDIKEMNISQIRGIDTARRIIEMTRYKPLRNDARVIVLNECHKATNEFQNAMLEVLEEPPAHTYFILCTTEPEKLLKTVRNRCVEYKVQPLALDNMIGLLKYVADEEEVSVGITVIRRIAQAADGSPRAALTIAEQVFPMEDEETQLDSIRRIRTLEEFDVREVCRTILQRGKWKGIAAQLKNFNGEAENVRRAMLGYFMAVLLNDRGRPETRDIACYAITNLERNLFDSGKPGLVAAIYMIMHPD